MFSFEIYGSKAHKEGFIKIILKDNYSKLYSYKQKERFKNRLMLEKERVYRKLIFWVEKEKLDWGF